MSVLSRQCTRPFCLQNRGTTKLSSGRKHRLMRMWRGVYGETEMIYGFCAGVIIIVQYTAGLGSRCGGRWWLLRRGLLEGKDLTTTVSGSR